QMQDLMSSLAANRRFDWGRVSLGGDLRQSIATGDESMTLPRASLSLNPVTFFRATPGSERWYSNATFTPGVISGSRTTNSYEPGRVVRQDQNQTVVRLGPSFSVGRFTMSGNGDLTRRELLGAIGPDAAGDTVTLAGFRRDEASWSANASYR